MFILELVANLNYNWLQPKKLINNGPVVLIEQGDGARSPTSGASQVTSHQLLCLPLTKQPHLSQHPLVAKAKAIVCQVLVTVELENINPAACA